MIFRPLHDSAIPQTFADRDCIHPEPPPDTGSRGPSVFHASAWTAWMSFAQSSASQWIPPFQWAVFWTCAKRIGMMYPGLNIQQDGGKRGKPMVCLGKWSRNHGFSTFMLVFHEGIVGWSLKSELKSNRVPRIGSVSCSSATNRRSRLGCSTRFILGNIKKTRSPFLSRLEGII